MEERPNNRPSWARRKFFINEHFQLHFVAFAMIVSLAACVFFYVSTTWFFTRYHGYAIEVGMRPSDPFFRVLYNMEWLLTQIFIGTSVVVILASIIGGILFSHKVAGPMYRLRKHMESVSRGDTWSNVNFRKNDYFGDVANAYNAQLDYIRQKLGINTASVDTNDVQEQSATTQAHSAQHAEHVQYETPIDPAAGGADHSNEPKLSIKPDDAEDPSQKKAS